MKDKPTEVKKVEVCALYLVKTLCLDTNATKATITQDVLHKDKKVGQYRVTIEKI